MPTHASLLFSRNLTAFVRTFTKDAAFVIDLTDDIQKGSIVTHEGEVLHTKAREALERARESEVRR
jgi:NAD(P) transhydrogenase subunit alpha